MTAPVNRNPSPSPQPIFELRIGSFHASVQHLRPPLALGILTSINALLCLTGAGWFKHL